VTVIDDRYNASPASVAGALRLLAGLPGRRLALLGKLAELGDFEREEHARAGETAAGCCDLLFTFGPTCRALAEAARQAGLAGVQWFETRDEAARAVAAALRDGDYLLVKGSRSEELEVVLPFFGAGP
jgi:UDP-N-acetylmuramoyl-tripeptide--D-alanyl-D-alanine ligase